MRFGYTVGSSAKRVLATIVVSSSTVVEFICKKGYVYLYDIEALIVGHDGSFIEAYTFLFNRAWSCLLSIWHIYD